jgi:hypothetical protein
MALLRRMVYFPVFLPNPRQLDGCHWSARARLELTSGILSEGMGGTPIWFLDDRYMFCPASTGLYKPSASRNR